MESQARYAKPVQKPHTRRPGVHRIVVALYAVLTLAAVGRSSYQVLTKFDEAPLAYTLSAVAAAIYIVATIAVALSARPWARNLAFVTISSELVGVVVVGAASVVAPERFPDATVWSHFGAGYLLLPLVLPLVGLWWLRGARRVT